MATLALESARESLHWLDWFVRVRRAVLAGAFCSVACTAALLLAGLRLRGPMTAAAFLISLAAPCAVLLATALKALSIASSMAHALREREQQLHAARRELHRRGPRDSAAKPSHDAATATPSEAAVAPGPELAQELRAPLQLIESNVAVLTEAFDDILPILDQHHASGPHLRVARLEYSFFRERVPVILRDLTLGAARFAAALHAVAAPARPLVPPEPGRQPGTH